MATATTTADDVIRNMIREELAAWVGSAPQEPELISVVEAAKLCGVAKSVIERLVAEAATNGFPAIRLGARTIKIDKRRLNHWFQNGGLAE